jgi:hypothetical protein
MALFQNSAKNCPARKRALCIAYFIGKSGTKAAKAMSGFSPVGS